MIKVHPTKVPKHYSRSKIPKAQPVLSYEEEQAKKAWVDLFQYTRHMMSCYSVYGIHVDDYRLTPAQNAKQRLNNHIECRKALRRPVTDEQLESVWAHCLTIKGIERLQQKYQEALDKEAQWAREGKTYKNGMLLVNH